METYFEDIKAKILKEIDSAEFVIYAAVAWITDFQIIDKLIDKMKQGIQVELIINDDDRFEKRKRQFDEFRNSGGRLFLYRNDNKGLMHNKFCIIDFATTITGSFNWTFDASSKHMENIIIERDNLVVAREYSREFKKIRRHSILFAGKRNNYDLANYANITHIHLREDFHSDNCPLKKANKNVWSYFEIEIEQGNKFGLLEFELNAETECLMIPGNKIFGFWKESVKTALTHHSDSDKKAYPWMKDDEGGKEIASNGKVFYDFECLDPNFIKHIKHSC